MIVLAKLLFLYVLRCRIRSQNYLDQLKPYDPQCQKKSCLMNSNRAI